MSDLEKVVNLVKSQMSSLQGLLSNKDSDISAIASKSKSLTKLLTRLNELLTSDITELDYYGSILDKYDLNMLKGKFIGDQGEVLSESGMLESFATRTMNRQMLNKVFAARARALVEKSGASVPEDIIDLYEYLVKLHNNSKHADISGKWTLYYPRVGSRFERSEQISTVDVISGDIVDVYLPGVVNELSGKVVEKAVVLVDPG